MKTTTSMLLVMALLLAACGNDDDTEDTAASGGSEVTTTTVESGESDAEGDDEASDEEAAPLEATTTTTESAEEPEGEPADATVDEEAAAPADAAGDDAAQPAGFSLRDFRYCEILITVTDDDGNGVTEVWGTPGVDPCTDEAWYALDPEVIRAENDASFIDMNGPRYFIVDGTADTGDGSTGTGTAAGGEAVTRQFGDITMNLLATTEVTDESAPYAPDLVVRTTTWTFGAGAEVYELTDPEGNVYTMQSYSRIEDRSLTAADLPSLGDRLDLPEGWSYSSRVLDEPLQVALSPDGAVVVQDDLRNAYQRNG